ncbi:MAG: uracil-DNA glycosylase [Dehalococcoidia bacterium]|nr:uracil-DNA glycosylase [Dehalococcoidia bacterium]
MGPGNGRPGARWLFVGEAPGRKGAGRTGIPFSGDESGRRFELLLDAAGLLRDEVFITNAVLCLPLDGSGRNRKPSGGELRACTALLAATLDLVGPATVVALGATALSALDAIEPHGLRLRDAVGRRVAWRGRLLAPLYHPSRQAELHRPWEHQLADWRALTRE